MPQAWYPLGHGDKALLEEPLFAQLGKKYGKSAPQIILRWHIQSGNIVIPGSKNPDHIKSNFDLFDFALTDDEMAQVAALNKNVRYYTKHPRTAEKVCGNGSAGGRAEVKRFLSLVLVLALILALAGCGAATAVPTQPETTPAPSAEPTEDSLESTASTVTSEPVQTGLFAEQIFSGADGDIHYSYYLPDSYAGSRKFPMMVVMPGYNMMWFGEDSSGSNLNWNGFTAWTRLDTEMVVVSAQLTDWGEKSARQAIELTEYFINRFAVDTSRIYAAGYSAGGETMSRAVSMRPDLYAAYLHGASQWDGSYAPIAENSVAIYIYMADGDEYYGSAKARSAYENLHDAYENAGWSGADIDKVLRIETPDNAFFNEKGIYNYHGGANVVFDDPDNLNWVISHSKG